MTQKHAASIRALEVAYDDDEDVGSVKCFGLESSFNDEPSEAGTSASVFEKARQYIETGWLFRKITYLYAERKTLVVFFIHSAVTMVIFMHYFVVKYREREEQVQEGESRYWWKMLAPTTEFAMAHTILLQMTLLPLTMSRLSIVFASKTAMAKFIPFNRMVRFHICLGYNMILTTCGAVTVSITYLSLVCSDGEVKFCSKFTSEIMITGYFMLAMLLIVLVSSYLRHVIPYRIFYVLHHLVFLMYILTAVHTFDKVHRNHERERSQTFKWFSAAVLYYLCDRAAMALNHSYRTTVVSSSIVSSTKEEESENESSPGSKMVIIKLFRPPLFRFRPGQYAFLRIRDIDDEYHPFSVASAPDSDHVEFYIEVFSRGSWTYKLWELMDKPAKLERQSMGRRIVVDLMGPYGTSLGNTKEYSHAIGIGSGTGIVPMMSLLKQHVQQLLRLDAKEHFLVQERHQKKICQLHQVSRGRMGSLANKMGELLRHHHQPTTLDLTASTRNAAAVGVCTNAGKSISAHLEDLTNSDFSTLDRPIPLRKVKREARRAAMPIYFTVALMFLPPLGVACMGMTYSFNVMEAPCLWMKLVLHLGNLSFHTFFFLICFFAHDIGHFKTYIDISFAIIALFADWYFTKHDLWCNFSSTDTLYYTVMNAYIILSLWFDAAKSRRRNWRNMVSTDGILTMDKVKFIWVTRSAALVSKLYPEISHVWNCLRDGWGEEPTHEVCEVSIYVTDKDQEACATLQDELSPCPLYRSGAVKFERPNFAQIIENHTIELITDGRTRTSSTLLAFCGNPNLSVLVNQAKISNDISTVITDHSLHTMEFVSESYGGSSKGGGGGGSKKKKPIKTKTSATQKATCPVKSEPPTNGAEKSSTSAAWKHPSVTDSQVQAAYPKKNDDDHDGEEADIYGNDQFEPEPRQSFLSSRVHTVHDASLLEEEVTFPSQGANYAAAAVAPTAAASTDDEDSA